MPPKIVHDDGFEIWLSHQNEYLAIYDSVSVSNSTRGEASTPTTHEGNFAGTLNNAIVQRKSGAKPLMIQLFIVRDFNFFSGNAVHFALHVVTADGDKEQAPLSTILKEAHDKKPEDPTGFTWLAVQGSEAPGGTVLVSLTRGIVDEGTGVFTALSGEGDEPYIVQIEWRSVDDDTKRRVTRGRQNGSATPQPVSRKHPVKDTKPKGKKSIVPSGGPSSADKSVEPPRAETSSEKVSPGDQDKTNDPTVKSITDSQTQAAGDADSTQDPSLAIRLRDEPNEANSSQSEETPGSAGVQPFTTPPTTFMGSDGTSKLGSGTGGGPEGSIIGSIPTLTHDTDETEQATRKRSAGEAFEDDREKDLIRLAFEVEMAKADLDVDDAKIQEMTDDTSPKYLGLLLKKARSHHDVVSAELALKKARLEGKKDAEYRELKMRKAEAHLAVLEAEEGTLEEANRNNLDFKVRKAHAEFGVAKANLKQMSNEGREDDVEYLRAVLKKAQAYSGVALAEFELKAAECGDNKDAVCFQLQTRKAEAHREAVQAQRSILLKTGAL